MESGHETRPSVSGHGRNISGLTLSETFLHSPKIGYPQQTLRGATPSHRCVTPKVQKVRDNLLKSLSLPRLAALQAHVAPVWRCAGPRCPRLAAPQAHVAPGEELSRPQGLWVSHICAREGNARRHASSHSRPFVVVQHLVTNALPPAFRDVGGLCSHVRSPRCGSRRRWLPRRHPLRAAVAERSEAGRHLIAAVRRTREAGMPWSAIGSSIRHQRPSRATAPRQECRLNYNTGPEHRGRSARSASLSSPSAAS